MSTGSLYFFCGRQDTPRHTNLRAHKLRKCFFSCPALFVTSYSLIGLASLPYFVLRKNKNTVKANNQLSSSRERMTSTQTCKNYSPNYNINNYGQCTQAGVSPRARAHTAAPRGCKLWGGHFPELGTSGSQFAWLFIASIAQSGLTPVWNTWHLNPQGSTTA